MYVQKKLGAVLSQDEREKQACEQDHDSGDEHDDEFPDSFPGQQEEGVGAAAHEPREEETACNSNRGGEALQAKCMLCLEKRRHSTATACGHLFCWSCISEVRFWVLCVGERGVGREARGCERRSGRAWKSSCLMYLGHARGSRHMWNAWVASCVDGIMRDVWVERHVRVAAD